MTSCARRQPGRLSLIRFCLWGRARLHAVLGEGTIVGIDTANVYVIRFDKLGTERSLHYSAVTGLGENKIK